jgi:hypothetical protein
VAFELLTGRRPFGGDTPTTEAFAHLHAAVPRVGEVDPTLPLALDSVFASALAKDPGARPGSARDLVRRLREALDDPPATAAAPTRVLRSQPREPRRRGLVRHDHRARRRRGLVAALAALVLIGLGVGVAALVTSGDGFAPRQATAQEARRSEAASTSAARETTPTEPQTPSGAALNRDGFARMQAGSFAGALPLLREAVLALKGSNTLDEAYASYNLAFSRFALGRCDGVVGLLDRSERIQGRRSEIDELRRQWAAQCAPGEDGEVAPSGDPRGKAKGHHKGEGDEG